MKIDSVEQIVAEITDLRHKHSMSRLNIYNYLNKKYGLNKSRAYELINIASDEIADFYKDYNKNALEEGIQNLEDLLERARLEDDKNLELKIQQELNKMLLKQETSILKDDNKINIIVNGYNSKSD